jgi:general secretion pathway protein H
MRTSATGAERVRAGAAARSERGFTLVELMVVIAIIGLAAGVAVLSFPDARGSLRGDAERFAARVRVAQSAAVIESHDVALTVRADGYSFAQYRRGRWLPMAEKSFAPQRWVGGAQAVVGEAGSARIVFDTTGLAPPLDVLLVRDAERVRVRLEGDGSVHVDA